jgi:hypothetical protein
MGHFPKHALIAILLVCIGPGTVAASAQEQLLSQCLTATGASEEETILTFHHELRLALAAEDPTYLTLLSRYPLRVNDGGVRIDIADAATLYSKVDAVFPEVLRSRVLDTDPMDVICASGGIGYGNGLLWADVRRDRDTERFEIYSVNVPDAATGRPPGVRFVCRTTEFRSVVDGRVDGSFRFRSWNTPRPINEPPDLELLSERSDIEGTGVCAHRIFWFEDQDATYSVSEIGCSEASPPDHAVGVFSMGSGGVEMASGWCY